MKRRKYFSFIFSVIIICLFPTGCELNKEGKIYPDLTGAYSCEENSPYSGYKKFLVEIDKVSSQENLYIISNFNNLGNLEFLYASLFNDTLRIENQVISSVFINGSGKVNQDLNNIEWFYTTDDGNIVLEFFARFTR
ncbi:MAG: hypothetical protein K9H49_04585 [Bacteroidales bacterium]|nr:hypothetical protein [Bacteroidales bacterium]